MMTSLPTTPGSSLPVRLTRAIGGTDPDAFVQVNFLKVGGPAQQQAYETLLTEYATPFWTEALEGAGQSWATYVLTQPGGAAAAHNNASTVGFAEFANTAPRTDFPEVFARANPGVNLQEIGPLFGDVSTQVRQELWELRLTTE